MLGVTCFCLACLERFELLKLLSAAIEQRFFSSFFVEKPVVTVGQGTEGALADNCEGRSEVVVFQAQHGCSRRPSVLRTPLGK